MSSSNLENINEDSSKKELRKKILEQMEFYFSDSNLTKDRFLKQEISNSDEGYIDLSVFLRFNKIRLLSADLKQIKKAIKKSDLLELNENGTMVRRKMPFVEVTQKDIDKKTIYVENLPLNIKNDDLKSYFAKFGKINYISLPKFKTTNQLKGFAFIEFDQKKDAKSAVQNFKDNSKSETEPIGKFPKFNAQIIELEKKIKKVNDEISNLKNENALKIDDAKAEEKRKLESDESEKPSSKKSLDQLKKKKEQQTDEDIFINIRVVSKKDWLKSKDEYLENQKKEVERLKEKLNFLNKNLIDLKENILKQKTSKIKTEDIHKACIIKILLNLNNEKEFELSKMGRQKFKDAFLKDYFDHIAYVDLEKNSNRILIRCKTSESALVLLNEDKFLNGLNKSLLEGKEESEYFEKIYSNRNKKQERKEKKEKQKEINQDKKQNNVSKSNIINFILNQESKTITSIKDSKHIKFDDNDQD